MKLHIQHIWPEPSADQMIGPAMKAVYDGVRSVVERAVGLDTTIVESFNSRSAYCSSVASLEAYNAVGLLEGLRGAEGAGCDVAMVACGNDPSLQAARSLLTIPVVGATEAAMLLASSLGGRFGLITFDDPSVALTERNIRASGLEARAVSHRPVRSPGFYENPAVWFNDQDYLKSTVIPRFEEVARGLIADGADVIIAACGNYAVFPLAGYSMISDSGVPVIDSITAGALHARSLGNLKRQFGITTSKATGPYRGLPTEMTCNFLAPFAQL